MDIEFKHSFIFKRSKSTSKNFSVRMPNDITLEKGSYLVRIYKIDFTED